MAPTLRRLDRNDIPELLQLCREHARYERASWREHESDAALASLLLDRDDVRCWVADGGDGLVGFATAMLERSTWDAARYLHLDCIYLRAAHRGQGIGQALMAEVAQAAIEMGAVNVQWQTPSWNEGAGALLRPARRVPGGEAALHARHGPVHRARRVAAGVPRAGMMSAREPAARSQTSHYGRTHDYHEPQARNARCIASPERPSRGRHRSGRAGASSSSRRRGCCAGSMTVSRRAAWGAPRRSRRSPAPSRAVSVTRASDWTARSRTCGNSSFRTRWRFRTRYTWVSSTVLHSPGASLRSRSSAR